MALSNQTLCRNSTVSFVFVFFSLQSALGSEMVDKRKLIRLYLVGNRFFYYFFD
jgi:hypothetical protein